jgi:hypothetical protein
LAALDRGRCLRWGSGSRRTLLRRRLFRLARPFVELAQPGLEAEALDKPAQLCAVAVAVGEFVQRDRERHVALHLDQLAALWQPVERPPQVFADDAADLGVVFHDAFERAVLLDPARRGFRPDLVDSRDVVDRIPGEREIVDDSLGRDAELRFDALRIERLVRHRVDERHALVDELREILVAGRDHAAPAFARSLGCERRDHVVGLDPFDRQNRPAECGDQLFQRLDLHAEVVGHCGAIRLVLRILLVAKRLSFRVEHARARLRVVLRRELAQHVRDSVHRTGRLSARVAQLRQRVKRSIEVRRAVDEQQRSLGIGAQT